MVHLRKWPNPSSGLRPPPRFAKVARTISLRLITVRFYNEICMSSKVTPCTGMSRREPFLPLSVILLLTSKQSCIGILFGGLGDRIPSLGAWRSCPAPDGPPAPRHGALDLAQEAQKRQHTRRLSRWIAAGVSTSFCAGIPWGTHLAASCSASCSALMALQP